MYNHNSKYALTGRLATLLFIAVLPLPALSVPASCPVPQTAAIAPSTGLSGETRMTSDSAEVEDNGASRLSGNVRLEKDGRSLEADELYFDPNTGEAWVRGNAQFRTPTLRVEADSARIRIDNQEGDFLNTRFALLETGGRGRAALFSSKDGIIHLEDSEYTTCPEQQESWLIRADRLELDTNTGWGKAWGSKLRLLDTTVFYIPYIWFPIDDRRKTGLLLPDISNSDSTGFAYAQPYYLNLAPNYDATLTPRFMSNRGLQMNSELRYLTTGMRGHLRVEYLHEDEQTGETRELHQGYHQGRIGKNASLLLDYTRVSEETYFDDLDNTLTFSAQNFLDQRLNFAWTPTRWLSSDLLISRAQTLSSTLLVSERPYQRLPRLRIGVHSPNPDGLRMQLRTEMARFEHEDPLKPMGWRYHAEPSLEYIRDRGATYWKNRLAWRHTVYDLKDPLLEENPTRSLPSFSSHFGLRFERLMKNGGLHLLEPQLFYLYVEEENQDDLPIFDSGEPDLRFDRLFSENRYIGIDRITDAHHVALAASSRWLDPETGDVRTRLSFGQILRLEDPTVFLPEGLPINTSQSDLVTEAMHRFNHRWSSQVTLLLDTESDELSRVSTYLRYNGEQRRMLDIGYRYRADILEQSDLRLSWPVFERWRLLARWNHSLLHNENVDSLIGLEYSSCCWTVSTALRRYVTDPDGEQKNAFYVQFNLLGLGRIGHNLDRALQRRVQRSLYD